MSQYYSRLHIKVYSPKVWKKFEDEDDAELGKESAGKEPSKDAEEE